MALLSAFLVPVKGIPLPKRYSVRDADPRLPSRGCRHGPKFRNAPFEKMFALTGLGSVDPDQGSEGLPGESPWPLKKRYPPPLPFGPPTLGKTSTVVIHELSLQNKGARPNDLTPCFYWWAVGGSNTEPTD